MNKKISFHVQQRTQMEQMDSDFMGNPDFRQQNTDPSWDNQINDPDLSDILDDIINIQPDGKIILFYTEKLKLIVT